ncbi:FAD-dependent monooxygenase [Streptomyces pratensis]|uniref:FAD-dependent monooxygenase n=1 Tax=Streptomyces pratensis TaxID=1169025 RepID=UPI003019EC47
MSAVAVVGAGPVGLTAALAAHAHGLETVLLEARPRLRTRPGSRAIFVHRATLDHLAAIDPALSAEITALGLVWRTRSTLWAGRQVHRRTYPAPSGAAPFTSLPQTLVEDILLRACDAAGIRSLWGDGVRTVTCRPDGVTLRTGEGAVHEASHVIAADGARSTVREQCGITLEGTASATEFVVVDVDASPDPATAARVFHYRHPRAGGRNVLLVPFHGGWRVDVQCRRGDDARQWAATAEQWVPALLPEVSPVTIGWSSVYRFQQRVADRFTDAHGRVLLAGEAAHLLPPFGARGMNSGISDAVAAARAVRDGDTDRYASERRAAAQANVRAAGAALDHLLARRRGQRLRQWAAAAAAPLWPSAGRWLDAAPYGPRMRAVRY